MSRRWIVAIAAGVFATAVSFSVFATPTDGTYSGTASGQFNVSGCLPPGINTPGIVSFSGATATLSVSNNANNVTLSFSHAKFTASGSGFSDGLNLDLSFSPPDGNVNVSEHKTGNAVSGFGALVPVSQSGSTVSLGAFMIIGLTENCSVQIDFNAFTVTLGVVRGSNSAGTIVTTEETEVVQLRKISDALNAAAKNAFNWLRGLGQSGFTKTSSGIVYNNNFSGMNAGATAIPFGAWVSYSYSDFEQDFAPIAFDGDLHSFLAGIDYNPTDISVLGLAVGYEYTDLDTDFNLGEQETEGFTVAPYVGVLLTDTWTIDFSLGYTNLSTDQFRTAGLTTPATSEVNGDRWFGALNLNGLWFYDRWIIGGRLGALYSRTTQDDFFESNGTFVPEFQTTLGQLNFSGDVAYSMDEWEPFARVTYEYDFSQTETPVAGPRQPSFDEDNFLVGFGMRYFNTNGWSGNLEYFKRLGREDFDEDTISLTIRGEF